VPKGDTRPAPVPGLVPQKDVSRHAPRPGPL